MSQEGELNTGDSHKKTPPDFYLQAHKKMLEELKANFPSRSKKAGKEYVSYYSVSLVQRLPIAHSNNPSLSDRTVVLLTEDDPKEWVILLKIRNDSEVRVAIMPNAIQEHSLGSMLRGEELTLIVNRRLIVNRPTVLDFYVSLVAYLANPHQSLANSILEFLYSIDPDPAYIQQLHNSLHLAFDSEIKKALLSTSTDTSLYTILQAAHPTQLSEVSGLMELYDPRANRDGLQQDWSSIMDGKQKVFLAYSKEAMKESAITGYGFTPVLGYIATSSLVSTHPRLISIVTVPDERRRGMATLLIKSFFAQTCAKLLLVSVPKVIKQGNVSREPYHLCTMFKKLGADLDRDTLTKWRFILPNPNDSLKK